MEKINKDIDDVIHADAATATADSYSGFFGGWCTLVCIANLGGKLFCFPFSSELAGSWVRRFESRSRQTYII